MLTYLPTACCTQTPYPNTIPKHPNTSTPKHLNTQIPKHHDHTNHHRVYCKARQAVEALQTHSARSYAHLSTQDMLGVGMDMVAGYVEPDCMQRVREVYNMPQQENAPPVCLATSGMQNQTDAPSPKRVKVGCWGCSSGIRPDIVCVT